MPNITPLPKTVYNNSNGEPKDQETGDTRYEAWDAEQMSGKTNEIIEDVNINSEKNSYPTSDATKLSGIETGAEFNTINSKTTGEPTGSDVVLNVVSLTQAEYDAGTPIATTFYLITDA